MADQSPTVANQPPMANFTYNPSIPKRNQSIQFTDTSSDPDGTVIWWLWDFGDGRQAYIRNPIHIYSAAGSYSVSLTILDNEWSGAQTVRAITVKK